MASRFLLRRFTRLLRPPPPRPSSIQRSLASIPLILQSARPLERSLTSYYCSRTFCSKPSLTSIDHRTLLQEDEFHKLANSTIHNLLEKLEEYGDNLEIDGFDVDYGNEVLTVKLGDSGTYVLNKQTPNRQIWLSSPMSGPSRFDWDHDAQAWVYRRTGANLVKLLEGELEKLCGEPIDLS